MSNRFVQVTGSGINYYNEYTTTTSYVLNSFGGNVTTVTISNDSLTDDIQMSWDGTTICGELKPAEDVSLQFNTKTGIYIKGTNGGENVRIWGW